MRHEPSEEEPIEVDEEEEEMFPKDKEPQQPIQQEVQQIQQAVSGRKLFPKQEQKTGFRAVEVPVQSRIAIMTPKGKLFGIEEALAEILNSIEEIKQLAKE